MRERWRRHRRWIIVALCAYELAALAIVEMPTITHLSHRARRHPLGVAVILGALGWLAHHLLIEEADEPLTPRHP